MRLAERLGRWADSVGAGVFAVLFLSLVVQVVRRFVFGTPAAWTEELAAIAFVWAIFWGTAFTVPLSAHVAVDFVVPRFARSASPRSGVRFSGRCPASPITCIS